MSEDEDEGYYISQKVLSRKKYGIKPTSSKEECIETPEPTPLMRVLHQLVILVPTAHALWRAADKQGSIVWIFTVIWALQTLLVRSNDLHLEALVLPVLISASVVPNNFSRLVSNMSVCLCSNGKWGLGNALVLNIFKHVFFMVPKGQNWFQCILDGSLPFLATALAKGLAYIAGTSLTETETSLIVCGVANLFLPCSGLSDSKNLWRTLLICGLLAFLPCIPLLRKVYLIYSSKNRKKYQNKRKHVQAVVNYVYPLYTICVLGGIYARLGFAWIPSSLMENFQIIRYWTLCLIVAFVIATIGLTTFGLDSRRKLWHITSVVMFLPWCRANFTATALAIAIVLFLFVEMVRAMGLPPLGEWLNTTLDAFKDSRDTKGPLVVSHIYLILGVAVPVFAGNGSAAGVICLGLGDAFASQVGMKHGRHPIFGQKSLEGTLAFIMASYIGSVLCSRLGGTPPSFVACFCAGVLEAVSPVNDNLVLPGYMLALERLRRPYS